MSRRDYIPLKVKLAALICERFGISHEHAKAMHVEQVLSLVQWDHYPIRKVDGGSDAHWNLMARLIPAHRKKTATIDAPEIAKTKRVIAARSAHDLVMGAKVGLDHPHDGKWRGKPKRKLQGRGFVGHRKFDGTPVWRRP